MRTPRSLVARSVWIALPCLLVPLVVCSAPALAQNATVPGQISAPFPTVNNLSIEWLVSGDANHDATVAVRYRKQGDTDFKDAAPLRRVVPGSNEGFSWANKHAGSIFGLEPGTTYEIELTLTDPDDPQVTEMITATTRKVPTDPATPNLVPVTPASIGGALAGAQPGDVLVLGDGNYGEIVVAGSGSDGMPIVVRAEHPGMAIVEGDVRADGQAFVHVEDLVIHGKVKFNDAESIVVRRCQITTPDDGIVSYGNGVNNAFISDNVITGQTQWNEGALGVDGNNIGEGVQLTGAGNVVAFNRVSGFRDCLSLLEDGDAVNQVSDDFYGNDLDVCADDAIEADFAMGNVRVYQNRIAHSFMGISSQPGLGGPTYFIRNVMYDVVFQSFKLQRSSVGDVGLHNTIIKSGDAFSVNTTDVFAWAMFQNNLFIGGPGGVHNGYDSGPGEVMHLPSADEASCYFDYDGYGAIGVGSFSGQVGATKFTTFAEMQSMTTETHAVQVDLSVFATAPTMPTDPFSKPALPSFALNGAGAAIDKGRVVPNVNDGFAGAAPDLGAYELGAPEPVYGPGGTIGAGGSSSTGTSSSTTTGSGTGAGSGTSSTGSGGADGGGSDSGDGCGCTTTSGGGSLSAGLGVLGLLVGARRIRSRRSRKIDRFD